METSYGSIGNSGQTTNTKNNDSTNAIDETEPLIDGSSTPLPSKNESRSLWTRLTFKWFTPILHVGNKNNRLNEEDLNLIPLPDDLLTEKVIENFDMYWQQELEKDKPSLVKALVRAFGFDFFIASLLKLVHDLNVFVGPQVLHAIIVFLRDPDAPLWDGLGLTVAITLSQILMSLCLRHYFFKCYNTGLRVRTAVVLAVYRKALLLSAAERQSKTLGEITNLMSIDAQRLQDLMNYLNSIWSSPLQICLSLYFLWGEMGPSSLGGVAVILFMLPVTRYVAKIMGGLQKKLMVAKDARIELNSEVLGGMKIIKLQAWEESFSDRISSLREAELSQLMWYYVVSALSGMLWTFTPMAVALATFAAYIWSGHTLDVASALTALALFNILRFPLTMLPRIINSIVEAGLSIDRIGSFLLCQEHRHIGPNNLTENGISMQMASAAYDSKKPKGNTEEERILAEKDWELALLKSLNRHGDSQIRKLSGMKKEGISVDSEQSDEKDNLLALKRINFQCKPGEFVAVIGGVGSGKSSFVNAILGEVRQVSGKVSVRGKLAYFSQSPFIMNASVRDNILFAHVDGPVNEELYQRSLDCCALRHDLELLPYGDATEIGEKGITLSGGQKARIALARAIYHQADITLIDDALSAVDAHVAEHLFEEALVKELTSGGKRSLILVTNAIQYLKHERVDRIVVIQDGEIVEQGSYKELVGKTDSVFAHYLSIVEETGVSEDDMGEMSDSKKIAKPEQAKKDTSDAKKEEVLKPKKLMTEETRAEGHVKLDVYKKWFQAAGGLYIPLVVLIVFTGDAGMSVLSNWWLTYWSEADSGRSQNYYLLMYALINFGVAVVNMIRSLFLAFVALTASRKMFNDMLACVLHAPMSFFDTTPVGRLVNRFSKDVYTIDEKLVETGGMYLRTIFAVVATVFVISGVTPVFILFLIPMVLYYMNEQAFFTVSYRELKRLDSTSRSPIFALLGESVDGVAVIRSFMAEETLKARLRSMLNRQQHAYFLVCAAQSWLAVRLELVGTLIITFACLSAVTEHFIAGADPVFAGLAGLAISYSMSVTQSLNWSVRMASDMEANMVAVERVQEYTQLESEGERLTTVDKSLPDGWPLYGKVQMKGVKLRYRQGLPLVLRGLDIDIPAGSKVGVVGRTGAGKSTLMVALLRIVELAEGSIYIDDQDTKDVGLAKLRSNIAVIPQDPVLYSGTVRSNLDPFGDYAEEKLYEVLLRVGLYRSATSSSQSLSSIGESRVSSLADEVTEGGSNFSVGQRQLLVIARALLNGSKLVIMDEATAAVDAKTDAAIQKVMREEFSAATVLTVAHRINTIMDSNYILVMSDGRASEFDTPKNLLEQGGLFRDLVQAAAQNKTE